MTNLRISEEVFENAKKVKTELGRVFGVKINWNAFIALGVAYIKRTVEEVGRVVEIAENVKKEEK